MHIMFDLETLGTSANAAIVQIGAVAFEPLNGGKIRNGEGFSVYVRPHPQAEVCPDTVAFWLGQTSSARDHLRQGLLNALPEREALERLLRWPEYMGFTWDAFTGFWAHGAAFDLPILDSAFRRNGMRAPWDFRAVRDTRTLYALASRGKAPEIDWTGARDHHALDDAVGQCQQVQKAMALLGR